MIRIRCSGRMIDGREFDLARDNETVDLIIGHGDFLPALEQAIGKPVFDVHPVDTTILPGQAGQIHGNAEGYGEVTYQWFKNNTYYLEDSHDCHDRNLAFNKATETDKLPLGVFYINPDKTPFEENIGIYEQDDSPLFKHNSNYEKLNVLIEKFMLK